MKGGNLVYHIVINIDSHLLLNICTGYMARCATSVIHVWCCRSITCVKIQVYYMCSRHMCNTHVLRL